MKREKEREGRRWSERTRGRKREKERKSRRGRERKRGKGSLGSWLSRAPVLSLKREGQRKRTEDEVGYVLYLLSYHMHTHTHTLAHACAVMHAHTHTHANADTQ